MSTASMLEQYRIHDFVNWHSQGELVLNPVFQRRSVWDAQARVLLIDTVLRQMPVPKIYMRTTLNMKTKRSIREVVDGQQRLRAILDFANDEFALTRRAGEFAGMRYSDLDSEIQEQFLSYPLAVDSLLNASDSDVLEVFARLNTYTVTLNAAEKRHARFQGDFKWAVHNAARRWIVLWEEYKIVAGRDRVRMGDDSLMAEIFGLLIDGVSDGGAPRIDALYDRFEESFDDEDLIVDRVDQVIRTVLELFGSLILETPLRRGPQFLMLVAATAGAKGLLPVGQLQESEIEPVNRIDAESAVSRMRQLAEALDADHPARRFVPFVEASTGSTQRIATRRIRYLFYRWAVTGTDISAS